MNTESVLASPLPSRENGNNAGLRHQVEFYASFSRFTRQVLGGGHPHFKLPSTIATSTVASQTIQIQPSSRDDLYTAVSRPAQLAHYMRTTEQAPGKIPIASVPETPCSYPAAAVPSISRQSHSNLTAINPILLEKSDQLVKAEDQLRRQRIERELQIQVDRRRAQGREREPFLEERQAFDVDHIHAKALSIVIPISTTARTANPDYDLSESQDEDSYYSSKAGSWSPENISHNSERTTPKQAATPRSVALKAENPAVPQNHSEQLSQLNDGSSLQHNGLPLKISDAVVTDDAGRLNDVRDESYSPPAADAFNTFPPESMKANPLNTLEINAGIHHTGMSVTASPSLNGTSALYAPRPISRVSPLVVERTRPKVRQISEAQPTIRTRSDVSAPEGVRLTSIEQSDTRRHVQVERSTALRQSSNPRKRRREQDLPQDETSKSLGKRIARSPARSPEPYIKPEPMSPVPFTTEPPRRLILRDDGQADIEVIGSRYHDIESSNGNSGYYHLPETQYREADYASYRQETMRSRRPNAYAFPSELDAEYELAYAGNELRTLSPQSRSRFEQENVRRTDANLRSRSVMPRVVAASPILDYQATPHGIRMPVQYAQVDAVPKRRMQALQTRPRPQLPWDTTQYLQFAQEHTPRLSNAGARIYEESAPLVIDHRAAMPPPPISHRRIVVDQYGNEYLAVPTSRRSRFSIAPEDTRRASSYHPASAGRERYISVAEPPLDLTEYS